MSEAMRAGDFKPCALCGKGVMHSGIPLFYRLHIESMGVDMRAAQRAHGMEQYMGGHVALARVFEDPDIATRIGESKTVLVCQDCAIKPHLVAQLGEAA